MKETIFLIYEIITIQKYLKQLNILIVSIFVFLNIITNTFSNNIQKLPDDTNKVNLLIELSTKNKTLDTNIIYVNMAMEIAEKIGYTEGRIKALNQLGFFYYLSGDYDQSLDFLYEMLKIIQNNNKKVNLKLEAEAIRFIGEVLRASRDYDAALSFTQRAEQLFLKINDKLGLAKTYNRYAAIELEKSRFQKNDLVPEFVEKSNEIAISHKFDEVVSNNYNILGTYYSSLKDYNKGIEVYRNTLNYFNTNENYSERSNLLKNIANTFNEIGMIDSALFYARRAYTEAKKQNINVFMYNAAFTLFKIFHDNIKNMDSALFYILEFNKYKEQEFNEERTRNLIKMQSDLKSLLKDEEIKNQKKNMTYQIIIFTSILIILVVIIIFINFKRKLQSKSNQIIIKQKEQLEELNITKDKFFSIIAHDLKNPIGAFRNVAGLLESEYESLSEIERKDFARLLAESSKSLLDLLENLLTWSRSQRNAIDFNPQKNKISLIIEPVLNILESQYKSKNIDIVDEISNNITGYFDANMIYTVLRNIISNSIKFSYPFSKIYLSSKEIVEDGIKFIQISIKDNGVGIEHQNLDELFSIGSKISTEGTIGEKGTGLGLVLVNEFVSKNNGKVWIESKSDAGTTVHFTLPVEKIERSTNKG